MKHYFWALLWACIVCVLIAIPPGEQTDLPKFEGIDKLVHTGFFFVFTVLVFYGSIRRNKTRKPSVEIMLKVGFVSLFFAGLTELAQLTVFTYRSADIWDLFADAVGTGMGFFAYLVFHNTYLYEKQ